MTLYLAYGSLIESNIQLPELSEHVSSNAPQVACTFRLLSPLTEAIKEYDWFHQWELEDGSVWFACAKHADKYVLRFPDWADFFIATGGRNIECAPWPSVPSDTIRHLFLDQVLPRVLSQREGVVLHGAAIVVDKRAVLFMGESGEGKSTLAVSFSQTGFPLLTDDGLYVTEMEGRLMCFPSYPGVRLWPESLSELYEGQSRLPVVAHYTDKQRLDAVSGALRFANEPVALGGIFLLGSGQKGTTEKEIAIKAMHGQEGFREVAKGLHRFDVTNRQELLHQFDFVAKVVAAAPPYLLTFPHDFALLPILKQSILAHLKALPAKFFQRVTKETS